MRARWGSERMALRGQIVLMDELPGLAAELDGAVVGLLTYRLDGAECEIMSLDSLRATMPLRAAA